VGVGRRRERAGFDDRGELAGVCHARFRTKNLTHDEGAIMREIDADEREGTPLAGADTPPEK